MAGRIGAANHGANRSPDHNVWHDAVGKQCAHHADMGKAAGSTAAERKPDHGAADGAKTDLVHLV